MAAVTGIGMEPLDGIAEERLDRRDDTGEGVSVVGIAGQRLHMGDELAALATLQGGGDAYPPGGGRLAGAEISREVLGLILGLAL